MRPTRRRFLTVAAVAPLGAALSITIPAQASEATPHDTFRWWHDGDRIVTPMMVFVPERGGISEHFSLKYTLHGQTHLHEYRGDWDVPYLQLGKPACHDRWDEAAMALFEEARRKILTLDPLALLVTTYYSRRD